MGSLWPQPELSGGTPSSADDPSSLGGSSRNLDKKVRTVDEGATPLTLLGQKRSGTWR